MTNQMVDFKAHNGSICSITIDSNTEVFVYEDEPEETELERQIGMLNAVNDYFFNPTDRWSNKPVNVAIYPVPGRKADLECHVKAFLNYMMFGDDASDSMINAITKIMESERQ